MTRKKYYAIIYARFAMEKYSILSGKNLTKTKYLETWKLDNEVFGTKDQLSKQLALNWFENSNRSTFVLWNNESNSLVGYLTVYLVKHSFANKYIVNDAKYQDALKENVFCTPKKDIDADIYLFSTVIKPQYRDKKLDIKDKHSSMYNKSAFKILNEAFVDWICEIKKVGVSINYVFGERVTDDGEKYLRSMGLQPCFSYKADTKYAKLFTPSMFEKCSNYQKLTDLYENKKLRTKYDPLILKDHEYLSIKDNVLYYNDLNLHELTEKYSAPLEVAYTPMIAQQICKMKNWFAKEIKAQDYHGKYYYAYATKANYYSEVVVSALNEANMLETSSAYDIYLIIELAKQKFIKKGFTVICNGFKTERYVQNIKTLLKMGINVIPIIENEREFESLCKLSDYKFDVGLRYNSDFESRIIKNNFIKKDEFDNRFGFNSEKIWKMAEKISKQSFMTLKILHFHFGGSITNIDNYIRGFANIMDLYCKLKKKYKTLNTFDFGGGMPVKYSLTYKFNYEELVSKIVSTSKLVCYQNKVPEPNLIGEHGRFTVADHSFYIYKIDFTKKSNNNYWYIINGSLMNMTPDVWGIQQDFTILPINLYENDCIPVNLGGETCDPDDRYYLKNQNVKLFMPEIKDGQTLYIAIFGIGAYQEIISGIGGLHHCLIPEGNELVITMQNGKLHFDKVGEATSNEKTIQVLDYNKKYMKQFVTNKNKK